MARGPRAARSRSRPASRASSAAARPPSARAAPAASWSSTCPSSCPGADAGGDFDGGLELEAAVRAPVLEQLVERAAHAGLLVVVHRADLRGGADAAREHAVPELVDVVDRVGQLDRRQLDVLQAGSR